MDKHHSFITQILALTDYKHILFFVSMDVNGCINVFNDDGEVENEIQEKGPILNGCLVPNRPDFFLVSTQDAETSKNFIHLYRKSG